MLLVKRIFSLWRITVSLMQHIKLLPQGVAPGILGGIVKGFKGEKVDITAISESKFSHLESIFLKCPFSAISPIITDNQEILELNIGSSVFISLFFILSGSSKSGVFFFVKDDIEIDETPPTVISSHESEQRKRSKMKGNLTSHIVQLCLHFSGICSLNLLDCRKARR